MRKGTPPSREMCLYMAKMYWEARPTSENTRKRSWDYLICWAFYDMYIEGYWK